MRDRLRFAVMRSALVVGVLALGSAFAGAARADFVIEYGGTAFNGDTPTGSNKVPNPFLRVTFHTVTTNTVTATFDVLFGKTLPEFIDSVRFNSTVSSLTFTRVSGVEAKTQSGGTYGNDGGYGSIPGNFNVEFDFPPAQAQRLNGTNTQSVYTITGSGLTADSFNKTSTGGTIAMISATHLSGFGEDKSGAFQGAPPTSVPAPSSLALMGIGLATTHYLRRRKVAVS